MNLDVIQESGGFLVVAIDPWGYMQYARNSTVHRETRDLHENPRCQPTLEEAKVFCNNDDEAILELTKDGGGAYIWMKEEQKDLLTSRLRRFKSCYGGWPIRFLSI